MGKYKLINNVLGWIVFAIASTVYLMTMEPTASFWDCGEFISSAYKLEVGHPPGAPFFMLTANLFTQLASDPSTVAKMVNTMSALFSGLTILFLFWSITHLARKIMVKDGEEASLGQMITVMGSGLVGALAYTFSDTFWFSAVEGEVYAYSSLFTAVVFWLILKWEAVADKPHADRWIVLIAYLMGLSIGVHLLNLLCIPAIVLVYYYKKFPNPTMKGTLVALLASFAIVALMMYGVVQGLVEVCGYFELLFVNVLGMPYNSGVFAYVTIVAGVLIWSIWETMRDEIHPTRMKIAFILSVVLIGIPFIGSGYVLAVILTAALSLYLFKSKKVDIKTLNTILVCLMVVVVGYSSYALTLIRATADTPMNQNAPSDIFTLRTYLAREQYGKTPLLYGQTYVSEVQRENQGGSCVPVTTEGEPTWSRVIKKDKNEKDRYFVSRTDQEYKYVDELNMLFPRMYSSDPRHVQAYKEWAQVKGQPVKYNYCGEMKSVMKPTFAENLKFFFSYQLNFMYWRYFMWNFAGRQNDIQGNGEPEHGNWITGFSFIDDSLYGDQSKLPDDLKENKGHNVFYCMPLILGLIGLFWQAWYTRKKKVMKNGKEEEVLLPIGIQQFWIVFFLFFMTGLAIVIYLNQTPMQPRERDYAYAGSFYAYAIWCGLGVLAIIDILKRKMKLSGTAVTAIVAVITLLVPIQMASQTWDDHDRSNRYTCRDFGQNYLMSLQEKGNPIIFTNGDNDTFPLWYNQEVEGVGTDARVCNLSYLQTDWYIDQMMRPAYNSPSVPITWPRLDFCSGTNEYVSVEPEAKKQILDFYKQDPENAKKQFGDEPFELKNILKNWVRSKNPDMHFIPTDTLYVTIDKEAVKKSGMMMASDSIPDKMVISLAGKSALYKNDLMMLEMLAQCNWTRPLYVALTVGEENYMNLGDNFVQEGLVNRITPFTTNKPGAKNFDTEKAYHNIMTRFKFGNLKQKGLYIDETTMRMCYTHRRLLAQTALQLIAEGKKQKAINILKKADTEIPAYNVTLDYMSGGLDMARGWLMTGQKAKGKEYIEAVWKNASQYLNYYLSLPNDRFLQAEHDCIRQIMIMQSICEAAGMVSPQLEQKYEKQLNNLYRLYHGRGGRMPEGNQ